MVNIEYVDRPQLYPTLVATNPVIILGDGSATSDYPTHRVVSVKVRDLSAVDLVELLEALSITGGVELRRG
ncbi:hypothetical protein AB0M43_25615 [Longispora sp. NPDC051575]|uniref:hypothetical protein n=1 Tax=Longispora sp. NPDC051575 TaxID=3154943 RepID=UPI0034458E5B